MEFWKDYEMCLSNETLAVWDTFRKQQSIFVKKRHILPKSKNLFLKNFPT